MSDLPPRPDPSAAAGAPARPCMSCGCAWMARAHGATVPADAETGKADAQPDSEPPMMACCRGACAPASAHPGKPCC